MIAMSWLTRLSNIFRREEVSERISERLNSTSTSASTN
jgi:hypothetical protein